MAAIGPKDDLHARSPFESLDEDSAGVFTGANPLGTYPTVLEVESAKSAGTRRTRANLQNPIGDSKFPCGESSQFHRWRTRRGAARVAAVDPRPCSPSPPTPLGSVRSREARVAVGARHSLPSVRMSWRAIDVPRDSVLGLVRVRVVSSSSSSLAAAHRPPYPSFLSRHIR